MPAYDCEDPKTFFDTSEALDMRGRTSTGVQGSAVQYPKQPSTDRVRQICSLVRRFRSTQVYASPQYNSKVEFALTLMVVLG